MKNKNLIANTFAWLFIGLMVCFGVSAILSFNEELEFIVFTWLGPYTIFAYIILEFIIVLFISHRLNKMKTPAATIWYLLYTALTGLSLSGLFTIYTASSLTFVFLSTAIIFGVFAFIGSKTNIDLSKWSTYLFISLLTIVVLEIINIFLLNNTLNIILCVFSILVFTGYIAYDIKHVINQANYSEDLDNISSQGIYFAFQLFLDIINVFIDLLRLFGRAKD